MDEVRLSRVARDEHGSVLLVTGLTLPILLLFAAFSIEVGTWYVHKRSLQNRADAAALAAGGVYASGLSCDDAAITDEIDRYAGVSAEGFNAHVNDQSKVTVTVNELDGVDPCAAHAAGDAFSAPSTYWTDVKVRESEVGGLLSGFVGVHPPPISASARVQLFRQARATRILPLATSSTRFSVASDAPVVLTGAVRCSGGNPPPSHSSLEDAQETQIALSIGDCGQTFATHTGSCAGTAPWTCVWGLDTTGDDPENPFNFGTYLTSGYDTLWKEAPDGACKPNHWGDYPNLAADDPRLITIFVVAGNPTFQGDDQQGQSFPVLGFARFYVTGWLPAGCEDGINEDAPSGVSNGAVWGHFVPAVGLASATRFDDTPCTGTPTMRDTRLCVAALVR